MTLEPRYALRAVAAVVVLFAAWWFLWPDRDLTHEFRGWSADEPKSEGYRDVGPNAAELTVDRSGAGTYHLRLSGDVVPRSACDAVWHFLKADTEDPAPAVIEVSDPSGKVVHRKESGASC